MIRAQLTQTSRYFIGLGRDCEEWTKLIEFIQGFLDQVLEGRINMFTTPNMVTFLPRGLHVYARYESLYSQWLTQDYFKGELFF